MADNTQFNVFGYTVDQLLNLSPEVLTSLNESQLRDVTARLAKVANKRIDRLKDSGAKSPALIRSDGKEIPKFSESKSQSKFNTKVELRQLRSFLKSKTSTVSGYNEFNANVKKGLSKIGVNVSDENMQDFFDVLNRIRDEEGISSKEFLYSVAEAISDSMKDYRGADKDKIFENIMSRLDAIYQGQEERFSSEPDIYDLFGGPDDTVGGFGPNNDF